MSKVIRCLVAESGLDLDFFDDKYKRINLEITTVNFRAVCSPKQVEVLVVSGHIRIFLAEFLSYFMIDKREFINLKRSECVAK